VLSVPQYRIAGLYSMSNAEVVTPALTVPNNGGSDAGAGYGHPIALNANATWAGRLVTGGCDEGFDVLSFPPFSHPFPSPTCQNAWLSPFKVIWSFGFSQRFFYSGGKSRERMKFARGAGHPIGAPLQRELGRTASHRCTVARGAASDSTPSVGRTAPHRCTLGAAHAASQRRSLSVVVDALAVC
jgi:hypothetical protein